MSKKVLNILLFCFVANFCFSFKNILPEASLAVCELEELDFGNLNLDDIDLEDPNIEIVLLKSMTLKDKIFLISTFLKEKIKEHKKKLIAVVTLAAGTIFAFSYQKYQKNKDIISKKC